MNAFLRPFLIVGALGAALTAHAIAIDVTSVGTLHQGRFGGPLTTAVTSQTGGLGPITDVGAYLNGFTSSGDIGFTSPSDGFLAWIDRFGYTFENGVSTYRGAWYSNDDSSAFGAYSGYVGSGTIEIRTVATHIDTEGYDADATVRLTGEFAPAPVPEPASLCALGLGAVALIRRRTVRK